MFEKRYEGARAEKEIQDFWWKNRVYDFKLDKSKPLYSVDTPPPTVSGNLHIGHIFSYTQAEIIARFRRMQGFNVFYPFGFDDNGLPTERLVEKSIGRKAYDVPRGEFRKSCLEITRKYEDEFMNLWKSLGVSCDWNLQYSTSSTNTQLLSQKSFIELAEIGKAYVKESPVLWCTECQTSIAQAELESKEFDASFHYIAFKVGDVILEVATTRPELLFGVVCLFVNPDDKRYSNYIGCNARVPLYDFEVPIISDKKVSLEKGTGVVMCATFGDSTDVEWVNEYALPYKKVALPDGRIDENIPFVGGLQVKKARKEIVQHLQEKGLLIKSEQIKHNVSIHERCGTEVEIIPSKQWYIDVLSMKDSLLSAADKIKWYPASMKSRYTNWVENLKWDWCISRQRYYGIPIPVWYCKKCGSVALSQIEDLPINPVEKGCNKKCSCGSEEYLPETAVLDTWATSSITPQINFERIKEYGVFDGFMPMGLRTQAHEIIRTWTFYTIVKSLYHTGDVPWKDIMISGFVLAKQGEKISKSKDNSKQTPQELINEYSADAIRYWAANTRLGTDTFFDIKEVQELSRRFLTKLWNSCKFVLSHLSDFDPHSIPGKILPIDKWIIERTNKTVVEAKKLLNEYEIGLARKTIDDLFWKDLCDDYIEIVKERLYQPEVHGAEERRSAQYASYYCLLNVLKLYAIFTPHITEYIYLKGFQRYDGCKSIHLTLWEDPENIDEKILEFGRIIKSSIAEVRRFKSENNLSMRADIDVANIICEESFIGWLNETRKDILACTRAKKLVVLSKSSI